MKKREPTESEIDEVCYLVFHQLREKGVARDSDRKAIAGIIGAAIWRAFHEVSGWR